MKKFPKKMFRPRDNNGSSLLHYLAFCEKISDNLATQLATNDVEALFESNAFGFSHHRR